MSAKLKPYRASFTLLPHLNCPDIYYTPGGQSAPEPSPLDRRMFGKKMRPSAIVLLRVVAESEEIALEALKLIDVEYEVLKPVMSIDEAMAEDAPVVHDEPVVYVAGAPDTLEDDNSHAAQRGEHMIINFPIGSRPRKISPPVFMVILAIWTKALPMPM
ncbi:selenate reductase subunit YgfN [Escherichia coli]|uniref:Selenate reductase subunit YgfN n=1 Tax=Escherichia coli TaxID=562 RepID=A0A376ZUK0_ECOLX|nr:selenate reductase subunit YgfN [Escherichia coli]